LNSFEGLRSGKANANVRIRERLLQGRGRRARFRADLGKSPHRRLADVGTLVLESIPEGRHGLARLRQTLLAEILGGHNANRLIVCLESTEEIGERSFLFLVATAGTQKEQS
jgi:hypothetical protein